MEPETLNDGIDPSYEPFRETCWDKLSDVEKAARVAKRLRGPLKITGGLYVQVRALEELSLGDMVSLDKDSNAQKWTGAGNPNGIAIGTLTKGCFGWIQTKS